MTVLRHYFSNAPQHGTHTKTSSSNRLIIQLHSDSTDLVHRGNQPRIIGFLSVDPTNSETRGRSGDLQNVTQSLCLLDSVWSRKSAPWDSFSKFDLWTTACTNIEKLWLRRGFNIQMAAGFCYHRAKACLKISVLFYSCLLLDFMQKNVFSPSHFAKSLNKTILFRRNPFLTWGKKCLSLWNVFILISKQSIF